MELSVLNRSFEHLFVADKFESLLWTERYNEVGDFEFYTAANEELLQIIKKDYYMVLDDADQQMIVEDIEIITDEESSDHLKITGRSMESVLDRRIVWKSTKLKGNFQNAVEKLLNENVINPKDPDRKIPNFSFARSYDPEITKLKISQSVTGDNLLELITELCQTYQIGFKVEFRENKYEHLVDDAGNTIVDGQGRAIMAERHGGMTFSLYKGKDHSYDQNENTYVVFAPNYENVISSDYLESSKTLKNVTLVAGEDKGVGKNRRTRVVGEASGLDRRELYTDARDIQSELEDGTTMPDADYIELLDLRGATKLAENTDSTSFEFQVDPSLTYTYKKDYDKGDIVQVKNAYGIEAKAQILEIIRSYDTNGFYLYPTFKSYSSPISHSYNDGYNPIDDGGASSAGSGSLSALPKGGREGQVLQKKSDDDYDVKWGDVSSEGGGPSGTLDYNDLINKPRIEGVTLTGNKTFADLGLKIAYVHDQSGSASDVWTIVHNLGFYPNVSVVDSAGTSVIGEVKYDSTNQLTVTFNGAFKGKAYLS